MPVNNAHIKQFTEKRNTEVHLHTASVLQKYNQALELCSRAALKNIVPYTLYLAQALISETLSSGDMLGTPTQCDTFAIDVDASQKTRLN